MIGSDSCSQAEVVSTNWVVIVPDLGCTVRLPSAWPEPSLPRGAPPVTMVWYAVVDDSPAAVTLTLNR